MKIRNYENIVIWSLFFYFLFPLVNSGFVGDDLYNSQIRGRLIEEQRSILNFYITETLAWYFNNGRFFPIANAVYFLFYLSSNELIIKIFYSIIIFLNLIYFRKIIYLVSNSKTFSNLAILLLFSSFQFRLWHDPILSFHALVPTVSLFFLISTYYFLISRNIKSKKFEFISLFFYFLSLITYEVSYIFIGIFLILEYFETNSIKRTILNLKNFLITFSIVIFLVFGIKIKLLITNQVYYPSFQLDLNLINYIKAFYVQLFSSLNLTYSIGHIYKFGPNELLNQIKILDLFYFILLFFFVRTILLNFDNNFKDKFKLITIGLWLWIAPAIVVLVTDHRDTLAEINLPVVGYLPIYVQYFGSSILLLIITLSILKKIRYKKFTINFLTLVFTISTLIHYSTNKSVIEKINVPYKKERELLIQSFHNGFFDDVKDGDLIIRNITKPHEWTWFFSQYTEKKYVFCDLIENDINHCYPYHAFKKIQKSNDRQIFYFGNGWDYENLTNEFSNEYILTLAKFSQVNLNDVNINIHKINRNIINSKIENIKFYIPSKDYLIKIQSEIQIEDFNNKRFFKILNTFKNNQIIK